MSDENPAPDPQPTPPCSTSMRTKTVLALVFLGIVGVAFIISPKFGVGMVMTAIVLAVLMLAGRGQGDRPPTEAPQRKPRRKASQEPSRHERGGGGLAERLRDKTSRDLKQ